MLNIDIDEKAMCRMSKAQVKYFVRKHVIYATFTSLKAIQLGQTNKKKHQFPRFVLQPDFQSDQSDQEELFFFQNMRGETINGFKCALQVHIVMIVNVS